MLDKPGPSATRVNIPGFSYGAYGTFTKNKVRIQNFKENGDPKYICQNELDKVCFQKFS